MKLKCPKKSYFDEAFQVFIGCVSEIKENSEAMSF